MLEKLLDSVILIDHFNGIAPATRFLATLNPDSTAISVITLAEILVVLEKEAAGKARLLLDQFQILPIDPPVAEKAADLRRRFGWKLPDAFRPPWPCTTISVWSPGIPKILTPANIRLLKFLIKFRPDLY